MLYTSMGFVASWSWPHPVAEHVRALSNKRCEADWKQRLTGNEMAGVGVDNTSHAHISPIRALSETHNEDSVNVRDTSSFMYLHWTRQRWEKTWTVSEDGRLYWRQLHQQRSLLAFKRHTRARRPWDQMSLKCCNTWCSQHVPRITLFLEIQTSTLM